MNAAELKVKVGADVGEAESGLDRIDSKVNSFAGNVGRMGVLAAAGFVAVGAAVTAGLASSVTAAADFEQVMSLVGAVTGEAGESLNRLSELALEMGANTSFSATQAAQAMSELAKGGVSTADIMGGALEASLNLAAAGAIGLADSATIMADALSIFGLSGKDATLVADTFTRAANVSSIGVDDIAQSMKYVGPVAAAMGVDIQTATGMIAMLGAQGIKGSEAGTGLRTMLLSLASPSKDAAALMQELGINVFDAQGKMLPMADVAGILQDKLRGMTEQQRIATLETMFGKEGLSSALAVYNAGAEGIDSWTGKMKEGNSAQQVAAQMTNNLKGAWDGFTGSVETLQIRIGMALIPVLMSFLGIATQLANRAGGLAEAWGPTITASLFAAGNAIGNLGRQFIGTAQSVLFFIQNGQSAATAALGFTGPFAGVATALVSLVQGFRNGTVGLQTFGPAAEIAGRAGALLRGVVEGATQAFGFLRDNMSTILPILAAVAGGFVAFQALQSALSPIMAVVTGVRTLVTVISGASTVIGGIVAVLGGPLTIALAVIAVAIAGFALAWSQNWGNIRGIVAGVIPQITATINGTLLPALRSAGAFIASTVVPAFVAGFSAIRAGVQAAFVAVTPLVQQFLAFLTGTLLPGLQGIVAVAVPALAQMRAAVVGAFQSALPGIMAFIGGIQALAAAVLPGVAQVAGVIIGQLGPAIMQMVGWAQTVIPQFAAAFSNVASVIGPAIGAIAGAVGSALTAIAGFFAANRDTIVSISTGAWAVISGIIRTAITIVQTVISAALQVVAGDFSGAWATIQSGTASAWAAIQGVISGAWQMIQGIFTVGLAAAQALFETTWSTVQTVTATVWDTISTTISTTLTTISTTLATMLTNAATAVSTGFGNMLTAIMTAMGDMGTAVSDGVGDIGEFFSGLPGKITGAVGDLSGLLVSAGRSVIEGFLSGINSMIGQVEGALSRLTGMIPNLKGPPETDRMLLHENGRLIMQGLVAGFEAEIPEIERKLTGLTGGLQTRATVAITAGEREALPLPGRSRGTEVGATPAVIVQFTGNVYGFDDFESRVVEATERARRRGRG